MSTVVAAVMRRSYSPDMFDDLTDVAHASEYDKATGVRTLTFAADLDAATADAIWARMESKDDAEQVARAILRADRDALTEADPLRRLYGYVLGDE